MSTARKKYKRKSRRKTTNRKKNKRVKVVLATRGLTRQKKLTTKLIKECVELILEGLPIDRVCDYLSVSRAAFYQWKDKGERYLNEIHTSSGVAYPEDEDCAVFVQAVVRAKAEWQLGILRRSFQEKNKATWIRDMTMMERRDRANWGRSEVINTVASAPLPDDSYL